uniref:Putative secreted protein n=1 Tax=Anopheles darlingi TaxID=43151 RepID=A0A2M4DM57_ANODA
MLKILLRYCRLQLALPEIVETRRIVVMKSSEAKMARMSGPVERLRRKVGNHHPRNRLQGNLFLMASPATKGRLMMLQQIIPWWTWDCDRLSTVPVSGTSTTM